MELAELDSHIESDDCNICSYYKFVDFVNGNYLFLIICKGTCSSVKCFFHLHIHTYFSQQVMEQLQREINAKFVEVVGMDKVGKKQR